MPTIDDLYQEAEKLKDAGKYEEATAKCREILEQQPGHVLSHLTLAVLLGKLGEHEKAVEHAQKATEFDPTDAFNFTALSVTFQRAYAGTGETAYIRLAEDARDRAHAIQGRHPH